MTVTRARRAGEAAAVAAAAVVIAVVPFLVSDYRSLEFAGMGIFFIAILGLNVLTGYAGLISIGHGALMSVGGYTTAILATQHLKIADYWTIPLAGLVTGVAGLGFGLPALRLTGLYLALATFGVAVATPSIEKKWETLTGGSTGIVLPFHTGRWLYGVTWGCAAALFLVAWIVVRGRLGRAFRAIRDSEIAAASMGVNVALYKTLAFGISAFYAGVAGSLFAIKANYVNPETFDVTLSLNLLVGVVIAGLGSIWGAFAGAAFLQFVPIHATTILNWVSPWDVGEKTPGVSSVIFGAMLIGLMLILPGGSAGALRRLVEPLYTRRGS